MSTTFTEVVTLIRVECGQCGGTYAINERFWKHKYEHSGYWHCPYCDCQWGFGETEAQRLKKQLDAKDIELRRAQQQAASDRTARDVAEQRALKEQRKVKRAQNGVCPCCTRSFTNLRRHMATAHGVKNGEAPNPKKALPAPQPAAA